MRKMCKYCRILSSNGLLSYPGNHKSIFGSYWKEGQWGYACCHSLVKNSYCVGEEGKKVNASLLAPNAPAAFSKGKQN